MFLWLERYLFRKFMVVRHDPQRLRSYIPSTMLEKGSKVYGILQSIGDEV